MALTDTVVKFILTADDKTGPGVADASSGLEKLKSAASSVKGALAALGAAAIFSGLVSQIGAVVDEMDEAYKAAQKVGLSVESFTALKYAAELSGVPVEQLTSAMGRLNKALFEAAGNGESPQAKALAALGVSATDASGKIREADFVLLDLAESFAAMPDGPEKAALAMELFGKSGADLIPLLNAGKDGIRAMTDEARQLGVVMSTEAAAAAEQYNDNISKLQASMKSFAIAAANKLVPALSNITDAMVEATKDGGVLNGIFVGLGGIAAHVTGIEKATVAVKGTAGALSGLSAEAKKLEAEKSMAQSFRESEAASKALEKSLREQAAAAKAAGEVAKQEANVNATGIKLAIEQAKTEYELAKAKGNTSEATAAKNKITALETELARANAAAAVAEAEAALAVAQAKYKEALAKNENVEASEKELEAAGLAYKAKALQSEILEESISRTDKLKKVTDNLTTSNVGAAEGFIQMGGAASTAAEEVDKLSEAEQRLADIRDAANAARTGTSEASWAYALGAKGIKLTPEELSDFKSVIGDTYERIRGTYKGQIVYSYQQLMDQAIQEAVEFARKKNTTTPGNTTTRPTGTTTGTSHSMTINLSSGISQQVNLASAEDVTSLQSILERLSADMKRSPR